MPRIELIPQIATATAAEQQRRREEAFGALDPIVPAVRNDMLAATALAGQGTYRGGVLPPDLDLTGVRGATFVKPVTINAGGVVRGFTFRAEVTLGAEAAVNFIGCQFLAPINVTAGGKITATGCTFAGTASILNAGVAADSGVAMCIRTSGVAHTNTTVLFEV